MAVITIYREIGARGNYIGHKLAERLGYLFVDREVIHEVSMEYGVRQDEFERIYEHAPGVLERYDRRNREIVGLIGRIIRGLARRDNVVIVSRDAFTVLREYGDVLNVRIAGGRSIRIRRIQQDHFVEGYTRGEIPDYQASAWCMAVLLQGMTHAEVTALTLHIAHSGDSLDLHPIAPFVLDKHSTGGVGDKTTLVVRGSPRSQPEPASR